MIKERDRDTSNNRMETLMKVVGKMTWEMGKESNYITMEINTRENGSKIWRLALVSLLKNRIDMRVISEITKRMARGFYCLPMEANMKETLEIIRDMDRELSLKETKMFIRENGKMINQMAKEPILLKIMMFMKEIGLMEWSRGLARKHGIMMICIMDNGSKTYNMELENFRKPMEMSIKESLAMGKFKEGAFYRRPVEINMKVNGLMISLMDMERWLRIIKIPIRELGLMDRNKDKEYINGATTHTIRENGLKTKEMEEESLFGVIMINTLETG